MRNFNFIVFNFETISDTKWILLLKKFLYWNNQRVNLIVIKKILKYISKPQ